MARVYSSWVYNGTRYSFKQLWPFLRTILSNRHLSCRLRSLHIGNWGVNPYVLFDQEADYSLDEQDISLVHWAIDEAHFAHIKLDIISAIRQGDRQPLMALLLASLPNLIVIRAHVATHDPYLAVLLQQALHRQSDERGCPEPLGQLRGLYVFAEVSVPAEAAVEDLAETPPVPLRLDGIWPVLFLRSMRKLHLYDLDTDGIAVLIEKSQKHQICYINDLLLRTIDDSSCRPADIEALIRLPHTLLKISLFIHDQSPPLRKVPSKMSNTDIWKALHEHQKNIQYLDILRRGYQGKPGDYSLEHLKYLQEFVYLRQLRILLLHLTGPGFCDILDETNPPLKHALPRSLEALRLYGNGHCLPSPAIIKQIQELVSGGFHPLLDSITLEDETLTQAALDFDGRTSLDPLLLHSKIRFETQAACSGTMIVQPGYRCPISRAGQCLSSWGDMYEMRVDGNRRFFNMTQRIASPEDEEEDSPSLPYALQIHALLFTTHTRDFTRPGDMVFENYLPILLPPLQSFAIYFTHPDTLPSTAKLQGLYKALTCYEDDVNPRLDIYFLPGATEMDCLSHYRYEQTARGSVKAQISRFRDLCTSSKLGLPCSPTSPGRLPGMLIDDSGPNSRDRGTLFICTEQDWHHGQQSLCQVTFQSPDLLETTTDDGGLGGGGAETTHGQTAEQNLNPDRRPLTISTINREVMAINQRSPAYDEWEETVERYIANETYEADDELKRVWAHASYYGWTNWA